MYIRRATTYVNAIGIVWFPSATVVPFAGNVNIRDFASIDTVEIDVLFGRIENIEVFLIKPWKRI